MTNENQLVVMVQETGLDKTKADYIIENFQTYFSLAAEWERRAKEIVVTDESQKDVMAIARIGRLALREKRVALEKQRKKLKEQSLREGKAIDGIANVLKALIEPIEEYLDKQEHFVEYKKAEEERLAKIEADKKAEEERIEKQKAEAIERERIRIENEKLKREAEERERQLIKERFEAEAKLKAEREQAERKQKEIYEASLAEKKKQEALAKAEKSKLEAALKAKAESERKIIEEKKELERKLNDIVLCPQCGYEINVNCSLSQSAI